MSRRERLCRRLLIAYPKAYRKERGDEIVATILDQADARGGGVRAGEQISVVAQGVRLRVVSARPASAALIAAALAVILVMTVQLVSTPTYAATGAVRILTGGGQGQLESDLRSPPVLRQASRSLHGVQPRCSVSFPSSRGLDLTCHSNGGASATAMVHAVLAVFLREERALRTHVVVVQVQALTTESGELATQIKIKRSELSSEGRQSPEYKTDRVLLHRFESSLARVKASTEASVAQLFVPSAPVAIVGVLPAHMLSSIDLYELLFAALVGLVIGLLVSLLTRRRVPGTPAPES
jgi:hypothetical protein